MTPSKGHVMVDRFGRKVWDLRISLTQECNMSCFFCHREGEEDPLGKRLEADEVDLILEIAASLGFRTVKFTGGEPLMHPEIVRIVSRASKLMDEVSLTTNGYFLEAMAQELRKSGLARVNISLHSLNRETFRRITGIDGLERVLRGIAAARRAQLDPVKLNMVVLNGLNSSEVEDMMEFAAARGLILRLIELIPLSNGRSSWKSHSSLKETENMLQGRALSTGSARFNNRPIYTVMTDHGKVDVELVRSVANPEFCANCHRLRVTSDGRLKPCLMRNDNLVDLRPALENRDEESIRQAFIAAVNAREPYWR